jgi:hypothetical protein
MQQRAALIETIATIAAARREAQEQYDAHLVGKLSGLPSKDEQDEQSLASIVRLLTEAGKAVRDAVACSDRLEDRRRTAANPPEPTQHA